MRPIGQLETEEQARTLADYLFLHDIETQTEAGKSGGWVVWVVDEERVDEGKALWSRFRSMPDADEFHQAAAAAAERRRATKPEFRNEGRPSARFRPRPSGGGGLTLGLVLLCVATALATRLGSQAEWTGWLLISMDKIRLGQVWRLFTPVFLHFSLWHLLFNLLWMQDLGVSAEARIGTWRFAGVVAAVALVSNLAQYAAGGAGFGGMSGVVYGVFGYLWVRERLDVRFGASISPMTSGLLMVFLALGIFGLLGPTANAAHFSGLVTGMALGWLAAKARTGKA